MIGVSRCLGDNSASDIIKSGVGAEPFRVCSSARCAE